MKLEDQLSNLVDREQIKDLKSEYCYRIDTISPDGWAKSDIDSWLELFTDDIVADYGPLGKYEGKGELRNVANDRDALYTVHMIHNAVIDVEGDEATGKWYFEAPEITEDERAIWIQGQYKDTFKKAGGEWKISKFSLTVDYMVEYNEENGWVESILA